MSEKAINLSVTILRVLIVLIGIILIVVTVNESETIDKETKLTELGHSSLYGALVLTLVVIGGCVLFWALFGLIDLAVNFSDRKKILVSFVVFIVMLGIGYALASDRVFPSWEDNGVTAGTSKWVGAGLMSFYVLVTCAVLAIIWSEVSRFRK